jgi:hypothetical protein
MRPPSFWLVEIPCYNTGFSHSGLVNLRQEANLFGFHFLHNIVYILKQFGVFLSFLLLSGRIRNITLTLPG